MAALNPARMGPTAEARERCLDLPNGLIVAVVRRA